MKILVFCGHYPPFVGGLESHADQFNKLLIKKGFKVDVFTSKFPKQTLDLEEPIEKLRIIRFPAVEPVKNYPLPQIWRLKFWKQIAFISKNDYDVIISRTRFFSTSFIAFIYAKFKGIKWVHIEHGSDFTKHNWFVSTVEKIYDYTIAQLIFRFADRCICVSKAGAEFVKKVSGRKDCKVIYRGVEMKRIGSIELNHHYENKHKNKIKMISVGRLIEGKGFVDLLKACSNIKENFVLNIVGDGGQYSYLKNLVSNLKLEEKVIFSGQKSNSEVISLLKASDIFVTASHTEGLPTTVLEAALAKLPIIATNVGGTSEIVRDKKEALLVESENVPMLNKKISYLIRNKGLQKKLAETAYERVKNTFSWDNSINRYISVFEGLKKETH